MTHTNVSFPPMPAEPLEIVVERLRTDVRHLVTAINELKEAEKKRTSATNGLIIACVLSFLLPTLSGVWYASQMSARIDYHENRIHVLETFQR